MTYNYMNYKYYDRRRGYTALTIRFTIRFTRNLAPYIPLLKPRLYYTYILRYRVCGGELSDFIFTYVWLKVLLSLSFAATCNKKRRRRSRRKIPIYNVQVQQFIVGISGLDLKFSRVPDLWHCLGTVRRINMFVIFRIENVIGRNSSRHGGFFNR